MLIIIIKLLFILGIITESKKKKDKVNEKKTSKQEPERIELSKPLSIAATEEVK